MLKRVSYARTIEYSTYSMYVPTVPYWVGVSFGRGSVIQGERFLYSYSLNLTIYSTYCPVCWCVCWCDVVLTFFFFFFFNFLFFFVFLVVQYLTVARCTTSSLMDGAEGGKGGCGVYSSFYAFTSIYIYISVQREGWLPVDHRRNIPLLRWTEPG